MWTKRNFAKIKKNKTKILEGLYIEIISDMSLQLGILDIYPECTVSF